MPDDILERAPYCHASHRDGECFWDKCPNPRARTLPADPSYCPLWKPVEED